jgi:hypothetical protein
VYPLLLFNVKEGRRVASLIDQRRIFGPGRVLRPIPMPAILVCRGTLDFVAALLSNATV